MLPGFSQHPIGKPVYDSCSTLLHNHSNKFNIQKIKHNTGEQNRRKKISSLYSTLKALLPPDEQSRKMSMPATVSRVVKYIPELQKEVKKLEEKKEALLSKLSQQEEGFRVMGRSWSHDEPLILAARIGDEEVMVQITVVELQKGLLSEAIMIMEMEGFVVLNASCFQSFEGRSFLTLHLKGQGSQVKDQEMLKRKLKALLLIKQMQANI